MDYIATVMDDSVKHHQSSKESDAMIQLDNKFEKLQIPNLVGKNIKQKRNKCQRDRDILAPGLIDFLFGIQTNYKEYGFMDSMSPNPVQHILDGLLKHVKIQQVDNDDGIDDDTLGFPHVALGLVEIIHTDTHE